jgi:hypothetical protein
MSDLPAEASEADRAEQALSVDPDDQLDSTPEIDTTVEADPADLAEQASAVPLGEEDRD